MSFYTSIGIEWAGVSDGGLCLALVALGILSLVIILREFRKLRRELEWWRRYALGYPPRKKRPLL